VDNPLNVLARLVAHLQDGETRRVLIPGFYDRVRPLSGEERELIARAPINEAMGLHLTGAPALAGEQGYSLAERLGARPTLEVCGLVGGYTGPGSKTVIPASGLAKLSMRIVPDQDPAEIAQLCEDYLRQLAPPTIRLEVRRLGMSHPVLVERSSPAVQAAAQAYERSFGAKPVYLRGGGSIPIVHEMIQTLSRPDRARIPIVLIGFGLPDGNTHAPNENLHLPTFYRGIETIIHYLDIFAQSAARTS
jgi:acetylornithine deacetylase/succinyl-diaminopimelate desuccinylase-like protein